MISASAAVKGICERYSQAVNASDAMAYSKLFADDAIWMPPGAPIRTGPEAIRAAEGADYEQERLAVSFTPGDALSLGDGWVYGIAHVEGTGTGMSDGKSRTFRFTVTWLLQRQPDGEWKIKRQIWNHKPAADH